jgi:hypothetical protein
MRIHFGSYVYFVTFLGAFGVITWLLGLPWYTVALLAAAMIGLRVWGSILIRRHERDRAA